MGVVIAMRLQVTHLRTLKNEEVIVPNSEILERRGRELQLAGAQTRGLILHTTVGIGYETPVAPGGGDAARSGARTPGLMT